MEQKKATAWRRRAWPSEEAPAWWRSWERVAVLMGLPLVAVAVELHSAPAASLVALGYMLAFHEVAVRRESEARALRRAEVGLHLAKMNPHNVMGQVVAAVSRSLEPGSGGGDKLLSASTILLSERIARAHHAWSTLTEERRLAREYLEIEKARLGERLTVLWTWDAELDELVVPTLFLLPLVENAVRHGIRPSRLGGVVEIREAKAPAGVLVTVINTGARLERAESSMGLGLPSLRRRLELLYGGRARLSVDRRFGGGTVAEVELPK